MLEKAKDSSKHYCAHFFIAVVLWSGCFVSWIQKLTRERVSPYTWTDCKLGFFLYYFGREYSSLILVLMSVEKCFAVYYPLKSKTFCTLKTAKWSTGIVGFILAGYNVHWFIVVESKISKWSGLPSCVPTKYYHNIFLSVDSVLYSFGTFVLMFVINFAIALKFIRAKCNLSNSTESTNQALSKSATRGTAMVVTVSVMFLILTAPTSVNYALHKWYPLAARFPLYGVFMNVTQYLNHSINGVLYCIVGTRFRMELFKIFSRKKRLKNVSSAQSVNDTSLTYISGNHG